MQFSKLARPCLGAVLAVSLAGCAGDLRDLQQFVQETKQKHSGSVEPLPQFEPYQNFEYEPTALRDPFASSPGVSEQPATVATNTGGLQPDQNRRREPLEFFPLDTLSMVGVLEQNAVTWGLIQAPDSTIHRVLEGNYAGENFGQITRISEERISILEIVPDGLGAWVEREAALTLGEQ